MKQIFHHYSLWEDFKYGFYNNCSGELKENNIKKAIDFFNNPKIVDKYMHLVVSTWKYSCEHNLTNPSMNKIAYLGQASLALYARIPNTVTMHAWNLLDVNTQYIANEIAMKNIEIWNNKNKNIQTCLNII